MRYFLLLFVLVSACTTDKHKIDVQGHRGARGLMPENTIAGFMHAVDLGVTTLELDLVVSKDGQLVVSHEPYLSQEMCADFQGKRIASDTLYNLYQMSYEEISSFDCGSLPHDRFPDQKKLAANKPLLSEMVRAIENYVLENELPAIRYNIELKTQEGSDTIYHPLPADFSDLAYKVISELDIWERTNIQSFDFRTLQYFNQQYPTVKLAVLIGEEGDWQENIQRLGFTPEIYSSQYQLLSQEIVENLQKEGMAVIPWTVNDTNEMQELIGWGVDGIITDYPDRAIEITK